MVEPDLSQDDKEFLKKWFIVLKNKTLDELDEKTTKKLEADFREFLGENAERPHNRRMLAFIAGSPPQTGSVAPPGVIDDRQRLLAIHAYQLHDHSCNTGRANNSNKAWRVGLGIAFLLPAIYYLLSFRDTRNDVQLEGFVLYFIAFLVITFGIGAYYRYLERKSSLSNLPSEDRVNKTEPGQNGLNAGLLGIWVTVYISAYVFLIAGSGNHSVLWTMAFAAIAGTLGLGLLMPFKNKKFRSAFVSYFQWIEEDKKISVGAILLLVAFLLSAAVFLLLASQFG